MGEGGKFYGATEFNPRLISTQIVVMQAAFYFCLVVTTSLTNLAVGLPQSLSAVFTFQAYTWSTQPGLVLTICELFTALVMAVTLPFVVERAKKCLDFVATYHIFHFVASCFFSGNASTLHWWIISFVALLIAVLLGEFLCMQVETKAIKLTTKPGGKSQPCLDV
eukprot:TRINITY_DN74439_c0_g1_i1.p1 TRINITY_DN74439_c0_g1~~TRINITY_DN74439_c0_g1_i1.p1  ORF type:complete len:165 (+),score=25.57 TRINITY_DN74439_c0_g1_i1:128-622(+)